MKRCPACSRTYDEANAFCLADGTRLVSDALAATVRVEPGEQAPPSAPSQNYNDPADQPTARQQGWTPAPQPGQAPTVTWQQQQQQQQPPPARPQGWENQSATGASGPPYGARRGALGALSADNRIALASAIAGIGTLAIGLYVLFSVLD